MTTPNQPPTQTLHPWRATARTLVAAVLALLPVLPGIVSWLGLGSIPAVATVLAVAAAVTRVLAMPAVDLWLRQFVPWLAAQPKG